ncbi:hypothetical protein LJB42_002154 [Komagataella kurtzmanii]|nr:hypothetical protein LJB42_002154 [Komagataella kurtzmanii]
MALTNKVKSKAVKSACLDCKRQKLKCDGNKPCSRCIQMEIPKTCKYIAEGRKDKRSFENGSRNFVFKDQVFRRSDSLSKTRKNNQNKVAASNLDGGESNPRFISEEFCSESNQDGKNLPCRDYQLDFDFNDFNTEAEDMNRFLELLGDDFLLHDQELYPHHQNISFSVVSGTNSTEVTEPEKLFSQRDHLIEILFENEIHVPPGISKQHLLDLEKTYDDLREIGGNSDQKFLLCTALCLGALTIRKRELLNQSTVEKPATILRNSIPKISSDAYNYCNIAKALILDVLSSPTIDGFCGLALMANFMTMMISLEGQLYLTTNALQIGMALDLHRREKCNELVESDANGLGLILLFWNVRCSACMLSAFHGRQPLIVPENISTPQPCELLPENKLNELVMNFMQVRIQLAALQSKILVEIYGSGFTDEAFTKLEKELEYISAQVESNKSCPTFEKHAFYRSRLLMLELSCLRAQTVLLLYRPKLITGKSLRAVNVAKSIILDIWSQYTKQYPSNKREMLEHLDWNFCYPLRTATLTLWISCAILLEYKHMIDFMRTSDSFEYILALEVLEGLVQILPIEQQLIDLLKSPNDSVIGTDGCTGNFWTTMSDQKLQNK